MGGTSHKQQESWSQNKDQVEVHYICALSFGLHVTSKDLAREISAFASNGFYLVRQELARKAFIFCSFYTSLMEVINFDETFVLLCGLFR